MVEVPHFQFEHLDIDCGLSNPVVLGSSIVAAVVLGIAFAVTRRRRPRRWLQALFLLLALPAWFLLRGFVFFSVLEFDARGGAWRRGVAPPASIGCITPSTVPQELAVFGVAFLGVQAVARALRRRGPYG